MLNVVSSLAEEIAALDIQINKLDQAVVSSPTDRDSIAGMEAQLLRLEKSWFNTGSSISRSRSRSMSNSSCPIVSLSSKVQSPQPMSCPPVASWMSRTIRILPARAMVAATCTKAKSQQPFQSAKDFWFSGHLKGTNLTRLEACRSVRKQQAAARERLQYQQRLQHFNQSRQSKRCRSRHGAFSGTAVAAQSRAHMEKAMCRRIEAAAAAQSSQRRAVVSQACAERAAFR